MNLQNPSTERQESEPNSPIARNEAPDASGVQKLDLSHALNDSSLSIHKLAVMSVNCAELVGEFRVFDSQTVNVSPDALRAIEQSYLTPLFVIEAFALNYRKKLLRKLTRGNEKGRMILEPIASSYEHPIASGGALVVRAETVENDGQFTRRLTITFAKAMQEGGAV
jgi:hypothetical protein